MIKFLHLADLHLGYRPLYLQEKAAQRQSDFLNAFRRAVDFAIEPANQISFVLIAGDLFDSHNPPDNLVAAAKHQLNRLTATGIKVFILPGTHDAVDRPGSLYHRADRLGGAVMVTNPDMALIETLTVDDTPVHLYAMANVRSSTELPTRNFSKQEKEGLHIAFLHAEVLEPGLKNDSGEIRLTKEMIEKSGFDYIALGHYHNYTEYRYGATLVVYPGTLEGKDFTEAGERYLCTVSIENGTAAVEKTKANLRELREIQIDLTRQNITGNDQLAEHLKSMADPELLMKVRLTGVPDFVPDIELLHSVAADSFYYLDIVDETAVVESGFVRWIQQEKTIRGIFAKKMLQRIESAPPDRKKILEKALKLTLRHFIDQ